MIKITVELLPLGSEKYKMPLGAATIGNLGTGTEDLGNYEYTLASSGVLREGRITGFPRMKLGVWALILSVLKDAYDSK